MLKTPQWLPIAQDQNPNSSPGLGGPPGAALAPVCTRRCANPHLSPITHCTLPEGFLNAKLQPQGICTAILPAWNCFPVFQGLAAAAYSDISSSLRSLVRPSRSAQLEQPPRYPCHSTPLHMCA